MLGAGGMGVVYRGERLKLGKAVAIKFLDERAVQSEEAVARFDREARAISRLQHRHCVSILDFGVWRRRPYIVMEYIQGRPLNKEMGKPGMTPVRAVHIMRQILEALRHAHASGVVHRDLKPENVMLTETTGTGDFVKLLDFGLARIISVDEPSISMPKTVAGTPSYMSPEQARGEKADHRTDIYSAGVILYGMCTGRKPFKSDDSMELLRMHMHMAPEPPRKVAPEKKISPGLEKVILRALEKERDARYYHCDEFLAALETLPEAHAEEAKARRSWTIGAVVAALLLVAAGGGGAWLWYVRRAPKIVLIPSPAAVPPSLPALGPPVNLPAIATALPTPSGASPSGAPAGEPTADLSVASAAPPPDLAIVAAVAPSAVAPSAVAPSAPLPASVAAPPAVSAPPTPPPASATAPSLQQRVADLLAADKLADAERLLTAEAILEPKAGWVHLQLGELYYRRIWRKDAEREWTIALSLDPSLRSDPRLTGRLCATLGAAWQGTGVRLVRHVGAAAVPALNACAKNTSDPARAQLAARLVDRVKR
ncbi:MAG: sps1B [Myxococcales bacterium]|nr:sps1B [Myxococcales bacterium]